MNDDDKARIALDSDNRLANIETLLGAILDALTDLPGHIADALRDEVEDMLDEAVEAVMGEHDDLEEGDPN
jgi:transcriptional regulator of met regulon